MNAKKILSTGGVLVIGIGAVLGFKYYNSDQRADVAGYLGGARRKHGVPRSDLGK